jgi:hypothetical protein
MINNWNCDGAGSGDGCTGEHSEIRILPFSNGNLLLCRKHFEDERNYRRELNWEKYKDKISWNADGTIMIKIMNPAALPTPVWSQLEVYKPE